MPQHSDRNIKPSNVLETGKRKDTVEDEGALTLLYGNNLCPDCKQ